MSRGEGPPPQAVNLGADHWFTFFVWAPDDLPANRATYGIADGEPMPYVDPAGCTIWHPHPNDGAWCSGGVTFDAAGLPDSLGANRWQVASLDPLHIDPSVLCLRCGDHGHVHGGRWVPA